MASVLGKGNGRQRAGNGGGIGILQYVSSQFTSLDISEQSLAPPAYLVLCHSRGDA